MIYHGSCISGLHTIKANSKSHSTGRLVAYFSEDRCYALVCCRIKAENFMLRWALERTAGSTILSVFQINWNPSTRAGRVIFIFLTRRMD